MDNWNQIKVTASREISETVIAVMTSMDFSGGLMIEDYSDICDNNYDYIEDELLNKDKNIVIVSAYVSEQDDLNKALEQVKLLLPITAEVEVITVAESDWANNWKKYYKPMRVGKNIVIKPSWEEYSQKPNDVVVELDPGMAFGTGTHETTRMCMEELERYVTTETDILDVGCGSGILAITGLLLGAKTATGVDIEAVATKVARENGARNGFVEPNYTIKQGYLVDAITGKYDVVVANIIADVIIILSSDIKAYLKPSSVFICSGIIDDRADDVEKALTENGLKITNIIKQGEWVAIVCKLI